MTTPLKTLITKLNDTTRRCAERAASLCMARGHHEVDVEHLLLALLEDERSDLSLLCRHFDVPTSTLHRELEQALSELKTGNTRTPVFSVRLPVLFEHAWLIASLDSGSARIRSGHLLLALLTEPSLSQLLQRSAPHLAGLPLAELKHRLPELTATSAEAPPRHGGARDAHDGSEADASDNTPPESSRAAGGATPALDQFTTNLTQRARDGALDPVIGRDAEIRQVVDILMRRRQNNPILTGEAGVGKTAVVEGLALRIAAGDVPAPLQPVALHTLDMGLLQAGASVKGEFENRLKTVIDEVKRSPHPIILFIDEAHMMIGAGGAAGQADAANLLKPALARGELRTIAATTWSEYKKYFEKDAALARRFQVVKVDEPSEDIAAAMLRGMSGLMERHFQVRIHDDAITEAVRLSARYITGRQLPDKAVAVLDTACAKVALGQKAVPAVIESLRNALERNATETAALQREVQAGADHTARLDTLQQHRQSLTDELQAHEARWRDEQGLVQQIHALRTRLEAQPDDAQADEAQTVRQELSERLADLERLQGDVPLMPMQVDGHVVAGIVSAWTGIPLGKMVKDEIRTVLALQSLLGERIIGQDHAVAAVSQRVRTARARLEDPNKPKGVFLFVGPSGVGKTETAAALADILYGGERNMVTINMSEYQEAHSVSGLKGSPPGYVGYGEGGVLTEAVRRKPYSVVLLDEVEKAHPDVLELFFQVFDKGVLDDAEGREVDFRNTLIILTSNVGSSQIMQACLNKAVEERPTPDELDALIRPALFKSFKPAFLGRLKVVPYYPLGDDALERIIRLKLERIAERVRDNHQAQFDHDKALVDAVLARCTEVDSGARNVDHILNGSLLPDISEAVLSRMAQGEPVTRIKAGAHKDGRFKCSVR